MYYGSLVAAPYAGNVFSKIFDYTALPPSMLAEIEYAIMPDIIGKPVADAIKELEDAGLHAELVGEGEKVTAQTPVPQTKIAKNDTVLVRAE